MAVVLPLICYDILRFHQYWGAYLKDCNFECTVLTEPGVSLREITKLFIIE
jgi:hypothetical protein